MVSDRRVLSWIYSYAKDTPVLQEVLSSTLDQLPMPSLNIYASVIACASTSSVLDAMRLMSEQGVSSVAVLDEETGTLLSAVSVTDIGKVGRSLAMTVCLSYPVFLRLSLPLKATKSCLHHYINAYHTSRYATSSLGTLIRLSDFAGA
jgi:hypothetical protein